MKPENHSILDLACINKTRAYFGLQQLTKEYRECSRCNKLFITYQGERWCHKCKNLIASVFRFEQNVTVHSGITT